MAISFKPEGYSTVSPYLIADGAQQVIDFLKKAFGARELRRYDMPDGSIMHAEVRIGDTVVMIGDAGENWPPVSGTPACLRGQCGHDLPPSPRGRWSLGAVPRA
jgi:uncharacterized glyoxalase superfamily protein PhnB